MAYTRRQELLPPRSLASLEAAVAAVSEQESHAPRAHCWQRRAPFSRKKTNSVLFTLRCCARPPPSLAPSPPSSPPRAGFNRRRRRWRGSTRSWARRCCPARARRPFRRAPSSRARSSSRFTSARTCVAHAPRDAPRDARRARRRPLPPLRARPPRRAVVRCVRMPRRRASRHCLAFFGARARFTASACAFPFWFRAQAPAASSPRC